MSRWRADYPRRRHCRQSSKRTKRSLEKRRHWKKKKSRISSVSCRRRQHTKRSCWSEDTCTRGCYTERRTTVQLGCLQWGMTRRSSMWGRWMPAQQSTRARLPWWSDFPLDACGAQQAVGMARSYRGHCCSFEGSSRSTQCYTAREPYLSVLRMAT